MRLATPSQHVDADRAAALYGLKATTTHPAAGVVRRGFNVRDARGTLGIFVGVDRRMVAHVTWYDPERGYGRNAAWTVFEVDCLRFDAVHA